MNRSTCKFKRTLLGTFLLSILLSACSSEPASDNTNLASTTTIEQPTDAIGTADDDTNSGDGDASNNSNDANPADNISDDSVISSQIKTLVGRTLIDLNQSINQGQQLSEQQENCIGAFDPALGESLLSIDCDQALATGNVAIYMQTAAFDDTEVCHADVMANQTSDCNVAYAKFDVNTLWVNPAQTNGQSSGRPIPMVGATLSYRMQPNILTIENLPAALGGVFSCDFDINNELSFMSEPTQNCDQLLQDLSSLIDQHLS